MDIVYPKYTDIWNKTKKSLNTRFLSQPIYDDKYIKTKVKTVNSMILKERNHYICIAALCIDSVLKADKENYPQDYLEQ